MIEDKICLNSYYYMVQMFNFVSRIPSRCFGPAVTVIFSNLTVKKLSDVGYLLRHFCPFNSCTNLASIRQEEGCFFNKHT